MEDYQKRVIDEKHQLDEKIRKLDSFIYSTTAKALPKIEQELLEHQLHAMDEYSFILGQRISLFS